jgi:hypothetical protein
MRSTGSPFVDRGRLRAFLKEPVLKELGSYSIEQKASKYS